MGRNASKYAQETRVKLQDNKEGGRIAGYATCSPPRTRLLHTATSF